MTSLLGINDARRRIYRAGFDYEARRQAEKLAAEREAEAKAKLRSALAAQRAEQQLDALTRHLAEKTQRIAQPNDPRGIIAAVAVKHGLVPANLTGECKSARYVRARHEAIWSVRQVTKLSSSQIGKIFGNRDHSTILYAVKSHQALLDNGEPAVLIDETASLVMTALAESGSTGLTSEEIGHSVLGLAHVTSEDRRSIRNILQRVQTALLRSNRRLVSSIPGHPWSRFRIAEDRTPLDGEKT